MARGRSLNICHVTTVHPWSDVRIFERMCVGLAERGHRVTLIAPSPGPREERGVTIVPTGLGGKPARIALAGRLFPLLRQTGADIVHFHDPELLPWMLLFRARGLPARVVYDVHEHYPESVTDSNYFGWRPLSRLAGAAFGRIEPRIGRHLDAVVAVTEPIAAGFRGGRARVAVVRNLFPLRTDPVVSRPPDLPSPTTIVLGGVMDRLRLMPELFTALALLVPKWPEVRFLGFGDLLADPFGAELVLLANKLGIGDRVTFRSRVPWAELQGYLAASPVGLILLAPRQSFRWSLPNRLFEFMANRVPIIASDNPLIREVVAGADCGILLDGTTPGALAEAIDYLLDHPDIARDLGARGRRAIEERYNWETELTVLEDLYAAL